MAKPGRGGSRAANKETFNFIEKLPDLSGSGPDKVRAEQVREKAMEELFDYTMNFRDSRGYDVMGMEYLEAAQSGQQKSFIQRETSRTRRDKRPEMEKHLEENFHTLGRRINNLNSLFSNKSAKFWTDSKIEDLKKKIDKK